MSQNKLIHYLSFLSKKELLLFRDFVDSPFFNKHQNTKTLLYYILENQDFSQSGLDKRTAFQYIFPNKKYEEQLLSNLISYLLKLLRKFLIQCAFQEKNDEQQLALLETAIYTRQEKLFQLSSGKFKKELEKSIRKDSLHFYYRSRYEKLQDDFDLKFGKRVSGEYLKNASDYFDAFYIGEKLKMTCEMLARKQVTGGSFQDELLQELLDFVENNPDYFSETPAVGIYFLIYKMISEKNAEYYFQLKNRLSADVNYFSTQEGRDLYTHALNFCIGQLNLGHSTFRAESFEMYRQMLENGVAYIEGTLPQWDYTNIVSLGCELKAYEWIAKFIEREKNKLAESVRENTYTYNLAAFHYSQKNYDSAIQLLQKVAFTDIYYNFLNRILTLKIYFEKGNWKALEYNLETFRIYLLRNRRIGEDRRKSGLSLIRFTKKLYNLLDTKTTLSKSEFQSHLSKLRLQIESQEKVLNRTWLLSKIEGIES